MRRWIPGLLLAVLTLGTAAGAAFAVDMAPQDVYFAPLPSTDPATLTEFHAQLLNTIDQTSFVEESKQFQTVYIAPGNVDSSDPGAQTGTTHAIVIGHTAYEVMGHRANGLPQWIEGSATPQVLQSYGQYSAMSLLYQAYDAQSVVYQDGAYVARVNTGNPIANYIADRPGQIQLSYIVRFHDGLVSSIDYSYAGLVHNRVVGTVVYFLDYDNAPPITPPPANELVPLVPCSNGDASETENNAYVCGGLTSS